jgi:hypothetical protein
MKYASISSYKMSSSLPSSALLMPHFFKDFTIVSLLTHCQEFHCLTIKMLCNRCTDIYTFGNNTYLWRIRCRSNLGHIFRRKKCVLWAGKYSKIHVTEHYSQLAMCEEYCHLPCSPLIISLMSQSNITNWQYVKNISICRLLFYPEDGGSGLPVKYC